jgi:hypothetical protein
MLRTASTRRPIVRHVLTLLSAVSLIAIAAPARAGFDPTSFGGTSSASILPFVDMFRTSIGGANNGNAAGPLGTGRREINWDGGGAVTSASATVPFNGFLNNRGASFNTPGTGFLQTPLNDAALTGIQATYQTTFATFSDLRLFTPLGSNITDVTFALPGSNGATSATVSAFGAVFTDVDTAATTKIELYDLSASLLATFNVEPGGVTTAGPTLSFLGVKANAGEQIARVRIITGNQALGAADSNGNPVDVVMMDDFIYSEPVAVPEPASAMMLLVASLGGVAALRRRRA